MKTEKSKLELQTEQFDTPVVMVSSIGNLKVGGEQWKKAIIKNSNSAIAEIKNITDNEDINTLTLLLSEYVKEFEFWLKHEKH